MCVAERWRGHVWCIVEACCNVYSCQLKYLIAIEQARADDTGIDFGNR